MTRTRRRRQAAIKGLSTYLLAGIATAAPLLLTAYLTWSFIRWVDGIARRLLPLPHLFERFLPAWIPGIDVVAGVILITILGFAAETIVGRQVITMGDRLISRIPLVRSLHLGVRQIMEAVVTRPAHALRRAGLIEYPRLGEWSMVLIIDDLRGELAHHLNDHVAVLLPMNHLFTGFLLLVKRSELIVLDMPLEVAAKMIMSGGAIVESPPRDAGQ